MSTVGSNFAMESAVEIAKTICSNPSSNIQLNEQSATEVADFISTLYSRLKSIDK